ncbi:HAD family hydrolase [Sphingomonas sp. 37zxx]|uniref:HAD family hydrolase n=1 Tax=Sphingomonas sp. 37zxx TaxID=1550073 RepID=UPI00053BE0C3|nr:HAD family hydrolase [Sphingomonas sp. 37zxx]
MTGNPSAKTGDRFAAAAGGDWVKSESDAVRIAATHPGTVIVDLDETLYLRNSTEQFIALASPGIVAAALLRAIEIAGPWRWTGGQETRDNWRALLIMVLFPWTMWRWRRFCRANAAKFANAALGDALVSRGDEVIIASNGYRPIITPLLQAMAMPRSHLICCDLLRFSHRTRGKLELVRPYLHDQRIAESAVITDSMADSLLLQACAVPALTVWKQAKYEKAFRGVIYLPGDYLAKVKRPGQGALKALLKDDLILWVLVGLTPGFSVYSVFGLVFLFFSMWSFYEIGYYDNDRCALQYEEDGKVTEQAAAGLDPLFPLRAAITGGLLGLLGTWLLASGDWLALGAAWLGAMAILHVVYRWYNRVDKETRVWLYLPLQMFRSGSLFLIVTGSGAAFAVAGSQMIARWIDYIIYRHVRMIGAGSTFPKRPQKTVRLVLCLLFLSPLLLAANWSAFAVPAALCIPYYVFIATKREYHAIAKQYRRLDKDRVA